MKQRWRVEFIRSAQREMEKLSQQDRDRILDFLEERVVSGYPRRVGHRLTGQFAGLWSYRVGDFRLIADIEDSIVTVIVVRVGNRREIYR